MPLKLLAFVAPTPLPTPFIVGIPHEYVVPSGTGVPVGIRLNNKPEHVVSEVDEILALGNTVTVTVKAAPGAHPAPGLGVTVYVAVDIVDDVLVRLPLILVAPALEPVAPPTVPDIVGVDQL